MKQRIDSSQRTPRRFTLIDEDESLLCGRDRKNHSKEPRHALPHVRQGCLSAQSNFTVDHGCVTDGDRDEPLQSWPRYSRERQNVILFADQTRFPESRGIVGWADPQPQAREHRRTVESLDFLEMRTDFPLFKEQVRCQIHPSLSRMVCAVSAVGPPRSLLSLYERDELHYAAAAMVDARMAVIATGGRRFSDVTHSCPLDSVGKAFPVHFARWRPVIPGSPLPDHRLSLCSQLAESISLSVHWDR